MSKKTIVFTQSGHSHAIGSFSAGDRWTGDEEVCRHFVDDARAAGWADLSPSSDGEDASIGGPTEASQPQ